MPCHAASHHASRFAAAGAAKLWLSGWANTYGALHAGFLHCRPTDVVQPSVEPGGVLGRDEKTGKIICGEWMSG
jgi:hypothetical protein